MKDKKFLILIVLAIAWIVLFLGAAFGDVRVSPSVERLLTFIVLGWFAYWTISTLFWVKKSDSNEKEQPKGTEQTDTNKTTKP